MAAKVARAQEIRQRAENVLSALDHPDDSFHLDEHLSSERRGDYEYVGKIGPEEFARAGALMKNGRVDALAAHDPAGKPGETVKFHLTAAKAQGLRAAVAGGLGSLGGALGNAAAYLLAKAITNYPQHKVVAKTLELASYPFAGAANVSFWAEDKLAHTSAKDRYYAVARADGSYEQVLFRNDNTLEYEYFEKT